MLTFDSLAWINHGRKAVFAVETASKGTVYMSQGRGRASLSVVEVDAERLLKLWRDAGIAETYLAHGDVASWRADRKYRSVDACYSSGRGNPVPLAFVSCGEAQSPSTVWKWRGGRVERQSHTRIVFGFSDGITRTIWLLANGAKVFPVLCSSRDAARLKALAGAIGGGSSAVDDLVPDYPGIEERLSEIAATPSFPPVGSLWPVRKDAELPL